jgi:hypothetical protein
MTIKKYAVKPGKSEKSPEALNRLWDECREYREQARRMAQYDADLALGKYIEFLKRQKNTLLVK